MVKLLASSGAEGGESVFVLAWYCLLSGSWLGRGPTFPAAAVELVMFFCKATSVRVHLLHWEGL